MIARILREAGLELTIVHGTKRHEKLDVNYVYTRLLSARSKHKLWINCLILAKQGWFLKAMYGCDAVYIPRYCYLLIPFARKLGKKVVVHLHDFQPVSYNSVIFSDREVYGRFSRWINAVKFELLEHDSPSRALLGALTEPINNLCRLWLREADAVICVSRRQAEIISRMAPELSGKIRVIYNPLPDLPLIEKRLEISSFLYLGGDSYVKGFHPFLRASQKILRKGHTVRFLFAGNFKGRSKSVIEALNERFKGAYKLLGHLQHKEVLKLHSVSHALLFPSICEEPLPYAVMESMLAGTIPIASRVGGVPEIVENTFAEKMLFRSGDSEELVDKMEMLLSMSREQLVDISAELREKVLEKFDNERVKRQLLEVFAA